MVPACTSVLKVTSGRCARVSVHVIGVRLGGGLGPGDRCGWDGVLSGGGQGCAGAQTVRRVVVGKASDASNLDGWSW